MLILLKGLAITLHFYLCIGWYKIFINIINTLNFCFNIDLLPHVACGYVKYSISDRVCWHTGPQHSLFYQEMYLEHMIRSMLKQLQLGEGDQTLLTFIDKAMRVEERKKLLESRHSQELSLLYILQEDYDRAKYYTNYAMQLFMEVWHHESFSGIKKVYIH